MDVTPMLFQIRIHSGKRTLHRFVSGLKPHCPHLGHSHGSVVHSSMLRGIA